MIISYQLSDKQQEKYKKFRKRVEARIYAEQIAKNPNLVTPGPGIPYSGVSGGAETWSITYTTIGTVITVKIWDEELDLSDYECW